jgi:hypothetical protein
LGKVHSIFEHAGRGLQTACEQSVAGAFDMGIESAAKDRREDAFESDDAADTLYRLC